MWMDNNDYCILLYMCSYMYTLYEVLSVLRNHLNYVRKPWDTHVI